MKNNELKGREVILDSLSLHGALIDGSNWPIESSPGNLQAVYKLKHDYGHLIEKLFLSYAFQMNTRYIFPYVNENLL